MQPRVRAFDSFELVLVVNLFLLLVGRWRSQESI